MIQIKQSRLRLGAQDKRDVRTQFGALCYRYKKGELQILLVTSRTSRRWIIPKGWPMEGEKPAEAALTEAYEEGGVKGRAPNLCVGFYSYTKAMEKSDDLPCAVSVFPVHVEKLLSKYPEKDQRKRKWFSQKKAARKVRETELRKLIENFDPHILQGSTKTKTAS